MHVPRMGLVMALMASGLGFILFFAYRSVMAFTTAPHQANPSGIRFAPPESAKAGIFFEQTGEVLHMTRDSNDFTEATPGGTIVQGESIATKNGTVIITIDGTQAISLTSLSELVFVSMLKNSLMFQQKSGTIRFTPAGPEPVSVRVKHALVTIFGETEVSMEDDVIDVSVTQGEAKVGIIDTENTTNVVRISAGERIRINDAMGTIFRL